MDQSLDSQIRERLAGYVSGDSALADFQRWFLPATWNVHRLGDPALEELVGEVGAVTAEYDAGHRDEASVREELSTLLVDRTSSRRR
jgi:hypothetical protein